MTPPPSSSLAVDLPLYLLLTSAFTLPLVQSLASPPTSTRSQFRALLHTVTKAVGLALGGVGFVVLGGGALLLGEKVYRWWGTTLDNQRRDATRPKPRDDDNDDATAR